jgi:hypothetical protein
VSKFWRSLGIDLARQKVGTDLANSTIYAKIGAAAPNGKELARFLLKFCYYP